MVRLERERGCVKRWESNRNTTHSPVDVSNTWQARNEHKREYDLLDNRLQIVDVDFNLTKRT